MEEILGFLRRLHDHNDREWFDAHRDDDMGQLGLTESDYTWITDRIKGIAKRFAKGRIVSCLEGGYNLHALARSVEAHVRVLADV